MLGLILSFRSSIPGKQSVCCICSKVALLCGVVISTTNLTGWADKSRSSFFFNIRIVCVGIIGNFIFGNTVRLTAINIVVVGTIRVIPGSVFFSVELKALVSIVTWILQWWLVGWGFYEFCCVACCVTVFICSSSRPSKLFSCNSVSR